MMPYVVCRFTLNPFDPSPAYPLSRINQHIFIAAAVTDTGEKGGTVSTTVPRRPGKDCPAAGRFLGDEPVKGRSGPGNPQKLLAL
jgi:hypothetical protein